MRLRGTGESPILWNHVRASAVSAVGSRAKNKRSCMRGRAFAQCKSLVGRRVGMCPRVHALSSGDLCIPHSFKLRPEICANVGGSRCHALYQDIRVLIHDVPTSKALPEHVLIQKNIEDMFMNGASDVPRMRYDISGSAFVQLVETWCLESEVTDSYAFNLYALITASSSLSSIGSSSGIYC